MATETETQEAECPTHGTVQATREIPANSFPLVVSVVRRSMARKKPFSCPTCGTAIR